MLWWRIAGWAAALLGGVSAPTGLGDLARWACPPPEAPREISQGPHALTRWVGSEAGASLRLDGAHRLSVARGAATFARHVPDRPILEAVSLGGRRWLFLTADAVWVAPTFLGALRPMARLTEPLSVDASGRGRVVLRDAVGNAFSATFEGPVAPIALPSETFSVAFSTAQAGVALTQGGGAWSTHDGGRTWLPVDLGDRPAWRLTPGRCGVVVTLLDGARACVDPAGAVAPAPLSEDPFPAATVPEDEELELGAQGHLTEAETVSAAAAPRLTQGPGPAPVGVWRETPSLLMRLYRFRDTRFPVGAFEQGWQSVAGLSEGTEWAVDHQTAQLNGTAPANWRVVAARRVGGDMEQILAREGFDAASTRWARMARRIDSAGRVVGSRLWVGDGEQGEVGVAHTHDGGGLWVQSIRADAPAWFLPWRGGVRRPLPMRLPHASTVDWLCQHAGAGASDERLWIPRPSVLRAAVTEYPAPMPLEVRGIELMRRGEVVCLVSLAGRFRAELHHLRASSRVYRQGRALVWTTPHGRVEWESYEPEP